MPACNDFNFSSSFPSRSTRVFFCLRTEQENKTPQDIPPSINTQLEGAGKLEREARYHQASRRIGGDRTTRLKQQHIRGQENRASTLGQSQTMATIPLQSFTLKPASRDFKTPRLLSSCTRERGAPERCSSAPAPEPELRLGSASPCFRGVFLMDLVLFEQIKPWGHKKKKKESNQMFTRQLQ